MYKAFCFFFFKKWDYIFAHLDALAAQTTFNIKIYYKNMFVDEMRHT
jgi:hypothetical protein